MTEESSALSTTTTIATTTNTTPEKRHVGCVEMGQTKLSHVESMTFTMHDFLAGNQEKRGEMFFTPPIKAHGWWWKLCVYPRGSRSSNASDVYVSVFLTRCIYKCIPCKSNVEVQYTMTPASRNAICRRKFTRSNKNCWGWFDFIKRSDLLDPTKKFLIDGSLSIDVDLQVYVPVSKKKDASSTKSTRRRLPMLRKK